MATFGSYTRAKYLAKYLWDRRWWIGFMERWGVLFDENDN